MGSVARRDRAAARVLVVLVAALAVVCAGCGSAGGGNEGPATAPRGVPPPPVAVVEAYLDALEAGDAEAARALCTERFLEFHDGGTESWFGQEVRFGDVVIRPPRDARRSATDLRYRQAVYVPVTFVLTQEHASPTLPDGPTVWGFVLGRNRDSEAWRIDDHGT